MHDGQAARIKKLVKYNVHLSIINYKYNYSKAFLNIIITVYNSNHCL